MFMFIIFYLNYTEIYPSLICLHNKIANRKPNDVQEMRIQGKVIFILKDMKGFLQFNRLNLMLLAKKKKKKNLCKLTTYNNVLFIRFLINEDKSIKV